MILDAMCVFFLTFGYGHQSIKEAKKARGHIAHTYFDAWGHNIEQLIPNIRDFDMHSNNNNNYNNNTNNNNNRF